LTPDFCRKNLPEEVTYYSVSNKLSHSKPHSDDRSPGWRFALLGSERQRIHLEFNMSFFAVNAFETIRYVLTGLSEGKRRENFLFLAQDWRLFLAFNYRDLLTI
jgi:hypothetical protein